MSDIERILNFWLDEVGPEGWYKSDDSVDDRIADEFGALWESAMAGGLTHWLTGSRGALAYLILTDQFSRNIHRGTARAFAADALARRVAKSAIARGLDLMTGRPARSFFYLPLMHSEILSDQERCVRQFLIKMPDAPNIPSAVKHREVIRKFGRFPSRNAALGRADSDAERAYREADGYMS